MSRKITAIYGVEPLRDGELPMGYAIGAESFIAGREKVVVDRIDRREESYGDHGLSWFDVRAGSVIVASVQARAVAEIHYGGEGE